MSRLNSIKESFRVPLMEFQASLRRKFGVPVNVNYSPPPTEKQFQTSRKETAEQAATLHTLHIERADKKLPMLAVFFVKSEPMGKRNFIVTKPNSEFMPEYPSDHYEGKHIADTIIKALKECHVPKNKG